VTPRPAAAALLRRLERIRGEYGEGTAAAKLALLDALGRRPLPTASAVLRFHECLAYLRAYPDDGRVLARAEALLAAFSRRSDLRRRREELADSGVAGTAITYAYYFPTARWLARKWPDRLRVDWESFEHRDRLVGQLPLLLPYSESPALDYLEIDPRRWIERLKGPRETDGTFLVRRFERFPGDEFARQAAFEENDPVLRLEPGPDTPSRTLARYARSPVVFQRRPLDRARPDLRIAIAGGPRRVRAVSPGDGEKLIDLARGAMITRARDLDVFMHADPRDVRLVEFGDGLQFAAMGMVPERRLLLETVTGFLTLKNGVPLGYVLSSTLFRSSEVAYNVFETFRGGESAAIFGKVLAMIRALFGADTFTLDPYQLGYGNQEGLRSGAWWFYYKLGFRPDHPEARRIVRRELALMKKSPGRRTPLGTLETLASHPVFYEWSGARREVLGRIDLGAIGGAVSRTLAAYGSAREEGIRDCADRAALLLGVRSFRGWTAGERLAWERWGPVVASLRGVERWPAGDRKALGAVIRAKGGRREAEFVRLFDAHPRLGSALLALSR
jgi:hypothetical protein